MPEKILSPMKAIRAKCLDCCCGSSHEVRLCPCQDCTLYPYRFGKNPYCTRTYTEEQKKAKRERLQRLNFPEKQQAVGKNLASVLPRVLIPPRP